MKDKKISTIIALLSIASILLGACQTATPERIVETMVVTQIVEQEGETVIQTQIVEVQVTPTLDPNAPVTEEPSEEEQAVTYDGYDTSDIPTLDPQIAEDVTSINYIESLFVHLTNYDLDTAEIAPEAATSWEISADGLIYTFHLRTDIPWVKHNPITGETTQEVDDEGNPRFVTAADFAFGIRRACDPNIGSYYSGVIEPYVRGCSAVLNAGDPTNIDEIAALQAEMGVSAPDPETLVIELEFPASYFLSMTPMWTLTATPQWAIEEHGENWIEAGNIVTNGRYVLHEWIHGVRRQIWRNPYMPEDMYGAGNIEQMVINVIPDTSTGYSLWLNAGVDVSAIPDAELQAHISQFPDETDQVPDLTVFYIAFRMTKPPFDDIHVRRAFSAAFDRQTYVDQVIQGQGLPMIHFAPPGIFGAPPIDEIGVGYDPEFARAEMEAAGYPNCEGFPQVTLLGYSGQSTLNWIEYAQANWSENLGCDPSLIQIEQQTFAELLSTTAAGVPDEDAPHMWTLAWGPDYADENNWVGDVLWCQTDNRSKRTCSEIDDLIIQAREESDPAVRTELYAQIEEAFFGAEGEYPFFPIWVRIAYVARHGWVNRTPALFGGEQYYNWSLDWEAKQAAQD